MRTKLFMLPLVLILLVALINPTPSQAEIRPALKVVGQVGGVANVSITSLTSGGQLYTNIGPRVVKMSLATELPGAPSYSPVLPGIPRDLKIANGFIYAALGSGGVAVLDVNTLALLAQQALPPGAAAAVAVAVGSQRLYLAAGDTGIVAYTLGTDKKTLGWAQTKTFSPAERITDVEIRVLTVNAAPVESLFASSNNFNVRPGSIFRFNLTTSPVLGVPALTSSVPTINALTVTNQFVYATGDDMHFYALDAWLLGTSASISRSVALIDALGGPAAGYQLAVDSNERTAYVSSQSQGLEVVDIPQFLALTPPSQLTATLTVNSANNIAPVVGVTETYLYIADGLAGLSIAEAPVLTRTLVTLEEPSYLQPQPANTTLVAGTNSQAFALSNGVDLWTIDTSTPGANPLPVLGAVQPPARGNINAIAVFTDTSLIVSASGDVIFNYQLDPLGVPTGPTVVDNPDSNDFAYQTVVSGTNAFVADGPNGLAIVDVTDPNAMDVTTRIASVLGTSNYTSVDVFGNYAYLVDVMDGILTPMLRVYDVTDVTAPIELGPGTGIDTLCGVTGGVNDLKALGTHVYLACGPTGVGGVDVSNPNAPALDLAASYATPGNALSLAIQGGRLYVADGPAGVEVFTIGGDGSLAFGSSVPLPDFAERVAVSANGNVYVGTDTAGLIILQSVPMTFIFLPFTAR